MHCTYTQLIHGTCKGYACYPIALRLHVRTAGGLKPATFSVRYFSVVNSGVLDIFHFHRSRTLSSASSRHLYMREAWGWHLLRTPEFHVLPPDWCDRAFPRRTFDTQGRSLGKDIDWGANHSPAPRRETQSRRQSDVLHPRWRCSPPSLPVLRLISLASTIDVARTFVRTEMEAYELPKLIPTTVGMDETSIGASAVPFG